MKKGTEKKKQRHSKGNFSTIAEERFSTVKAVRRLEPDLPTADSKWQIEFNARLTPEEKQEFQKFVNEFFEVGFNWNHSDLVSWYNVVDVKNPTNKKGETSVLILTVF